MRHPVGFLAPLGLVLAMSAAVAAAQEQEPAPPPEQAQDNEKLAYIAQLDPERAFYCRVSPRGSGTSETQMELDFTLTGEGPVEAKMVVTGRVNGRPYSARMNWRGTAKSSGIGNKGALIRLSEVYGFDADPLPGDAEWSDPNGDTISLRVEDHYSMGTQPYILVGTQTSEFGINDLRCLDAKRF